MDNDPFKRFDKSNDMLRKHSTPTAVNFINITRLPDGGIVNVEVKRQPSGDSLLDSPIESMFSSDPFFTRRPLTSRGSSLASSFNDLQDSMFSTSRQSPTHVRSLIIKCATDDAGNQQQQIIQEETPSSGIQRHIGVEPRQDGDSLLSRAGIGHHGSLSSFFDSKFPSFQSMASGDRLHSRPFGSLGSSLFGEGRTSLFDRFNEHAPPPFFEARRGQNKISHERPKSQSVHNIPIKIEGRSSSEEPRSSQQKIVYKIPINIAPRSGSQPLPPPTPTRSKTFTIPISTSKSRDDSEAEKHLDELTKQLQDEMRSGVVSKDEDAGLAQRAGAQSGGRINIPIRLVRPFGDSRADVDKKVEDLAQQLQKQLSTDNSEEYFGACHKCSRDVLSSSDACQAMGDLYHTTCFICNICNKTLRGKAFYNVQGKIYCEDDYKKSGFQEFAEKCLKCGNLIMDMILQAVGMSYHIGCFRCAECAVSLEASPFTVDADNNIYCLSDYYKKYAPKCSVCNKLILPPENSDETVRVVSMDKSYHVECFHCMECGTRLSEEADHRCYPIRDLLLCQACHLNKKFAGWT